jgi:hypothetical protein
VGIKWLMQVAQEKRCKVPAVLNTLQLMLTKSNSGDYTVVKQPIQGELFIVSAHAFVLKTMAVLDAAFGCANNATISRRAKLTIDYQAAACDSPPGQEDFQSNASDAREDEFGIFGQTSAITDEFLEHACFADLPSLR